MLAPGMTQIWAMYRELISGVSSQSQATMQRKAMTRSELGLFNSCPSMAYRIFGSGGNCWASGAAVTSEAACAAITVLAMPVIPNNVLMVMNLFQGLANLRKK